MEEQKQGSQKQPGGQHLGGQSLGGQRPRWPKRGDQGPSDQSGQRPPMWQEGHEPREERGFFVLRTYIVGRMEVRELHFDWRVKMVPASPGDT